MSKIRHGGEFTQMSSMHSIKNMGLKDNFLPQEPHNKNGVAERKNRIVLEATRTMLNEANVPDIYWKEAVYTLNIAQHRVNHNKTPYELWFGRPALVKHFKVSGSKCYIKRDDGNLGKFNSKSNEGIFLGYSPKKRHTHVTTSSCTKL